MNIWDQIIDRICKTALVTPKMRNAFFRKRGMKIGEGTAILSGCNIDATHAALITLGKNVGLSPGTVILAHDASSKSVYGQNSEGYCRIAKVTIGDNVFIGYNTIILPGTVIGNNCIISAGSVVHGKIPDNSVVSGNPAKVVGKRDICIAMYNKRMKDDCIYDNTSVEDLKRACRELGSRSGYVL